MGNDTKKLLEECAETYAKMVIHIKKLENELDRYKTHDALRTAGVDLYKDNEELRSRLDGIEKYAREVQELDSEALINLVRKGWVK